MPNGARARPNLRPDHNGTQRAQFESNKRKIFATQEVCGICGQRVDFKVKWPDSMSPCIDHIIPVSRGKPTPTICVRLPYIGSRGEETASSTPSTVRPMSV